MASEKRILVIDDEEEVQELMATILRIAGYQGMFARSGMEGVRMARETVPDLILLDVLMPTVDGFRVQELLQQEAHTAKIPILFVTAKVEIDSVKRAVERGAQGYIEKPFNTDELLGKIRAILRTN